MVAKKYHNIMKENASYHIASKIKRQAICDISMKRKKEHLLSAISSSQRKSNNGIKHRARQKRRAKTMSAAGENNMAASVGERSSIGDLAAATSATKSLPAYRLRMKWNFEQQQ